MEPILFIVQCPTCGAKLAIHDPLLVGRRSICPKCSAALLIEPPVQDAYSLDTAAEGGRIPSETLSVEPPVLAADDLNRLDTTDDFALPESFGTQTADLSEPLPPEHLVLAVTADTLPERFDEAASEDAAAFLSENGVESDIPPVVPLSSEPIRNEPRRLSLPPAPTVQTDDTDDRSADLNDDDSDEEFFDETDEEDSDDTDKTRTDDADDADETKSRWFLPVLLLTLVVLTALLLTWVAILLIPPEKSLDETPRSTEASVEAVENPVPSDNPSDIQIDTPSGQDESTSGAAESSDRFESADLPLPADEGPADGFDARGSGVDLTDHDADASESADSPELMEPTELTDAENPAPETEQKTESADNPGGETTTEETPETPEVPETPKTPETPGAAATETTGETPVEPAPAESPDETSAPAADEPLTVSPALDEGLAEPLDISRRLAIPVRSIHFSDKTLPDVISILTGLTGVPISLDFASFESFPALFARRVSLSLESTNAEAILAETAKQLDLTVTREPDSVRLASADSTETTESFDLTDLIEGTRSTSAGDIPEAFAERALPSALTAETIARLLADLYGLAEEGGAPPQDALSGSIRVEAGVLTVTGSKKTIFDVRRLLEQLRCLRRLPQKTDLGPETLIPETLGCERLSEPMTLGFLKPVTLREALAVFSAATGTAILLDEAALREAGVSPETRTGFHADTLPAERILTELLAGYGLTWTTPAAELVFITTKEAAGRTATVEIHLYAPPGQTPSADAPVRYAGAVRAIRTVGGSFWADPVSGCLIVRAPITTQRLLRKRLGDPLPGEAAESAEPIDAALTREADTPPETNTTPEADAPPEVDAPLETDATPETDAPPEEGSGE